MQKAQNICNYNIATKSAEQLSWFHVSPCYDSEFTFIDLFAGIGGIRLPFDKLGGECVFSSEIDKFASQTYQANFGELPHGDITKISAESIPKFDVLLAGFPCQAFSVAGKRKGFSDTRGTLFFEIERILEFHKPKCFLLENVKGLLGHDRGKTFEVILDSLENKLGYSVHYKVLNAKNFGMPQNRERVIIVGFSDHNIRFKFPEATNLKTRLGDILADSVDDKYTLSNQLWLNQQARKEKHRAKGNGFGYSLFNENSEYTSTISARYYKDGSEILIEQSGKNPRRLTPREAARLQGFPDSFKLVVSDVQAYKQFGNSVPTKMIEAVAINVLKSLRGEDY
ncbi:MAG: DNA cytosine methyltransferase [Firmicutes bacterium]|nr:DNA cytosine methyltransferase [Bacillota bacterium]